jgi:ParB family chromosome partitioning protein
MENTQNQYRRLSELHEWEKNPRSISKDNFERLKRNLIKNKKEQGDFLNKPLLITEDGTVLGGNMRLKALRELGATDIWVSVVKAETEEKKIEYALMDNNRVGQYEGESLADMIGNFPEVDWGDYDVDVKAPMLVTDLIDQFRETEEDDVPEVSTEEPVSKTGEVYQLGRHRLMCGDSTKIEDVEKLMDGRKADMVFTDPPYGMNLDTDYTALRNKLRFALDKGVKGGRKYEKVMGDDKDFSYKDYEWLDCKEQFWFGGDYYSKTLPDDGSWFVWDKRVEDNMDRMYGSCFELVWSKRKHKREIIRIRWAGIFGMEKERWSNRVHPTQKPIELAVWFYNKFSQENESILDLFGGSGTFLIACEQLNRISRTMELSPAYCDVIRKRYAKFIGKESEWQTITPKTN